MDTIIFLTTAAGAAVWAMRKQKYEGDDSSGIEEGSNQLFLVDEHNHPALATPPSSPEKLWCRATYSLVMHEPPHMFYEPKDWSCTTVLLLKPLITDNDSAAAPLLRLPGGPLRNHETYHDATIRHLKDDTAIDVCQPENCLHHLFTFPFEGKAAATAGVLSKDQEENLCGIWGDFYECVYRGQVEELHTILDKTTSQGNGQKYSFVTMTLAELLDALTHHAEGQHPKARQQEDDQRPIEETISFTHDTLHALKLYFQRQGDLRVQRRLLKGYSSADLEHYGLRAQEQSAPVLRGFQDDQRQAAVDFTLKTDDGMAPRLLPQADLVLLGVSRAGKTPLSIFIAQTMGLKVANVPLVKELEPPQQLLVEHHGRRKGKDKVDPRRVFCLTLQPEYLQRLRMTRLRRELKKQLGQGRSIYATLDYIQKDVEKAKDLCLTYGFTEIDVTGRAMEETASLILSKLRERFPDEVTRSQSVHVL
jgi:hypothetical protein